MSLAEKYGIGLILAEEPGKLESWEFLEEPERSEPDPERLDAFISGLRNQQNKNNILKWGR
jgi:hypothetical protein